MFHFYERLVASVFLEKAELIEEATRSKDFRVVVPLSGPTERLLRRTAPIRTGTVSANWIYLLVVCFFVYCPLFIYWYSIWYSELVCKCIYDFQNRSPQNEYEGLTGSKLYFREYVTIPFIFIRQLLFFLIWPILLHVINTHTHTYIYICIYIYIHICIYIYIILTTYVNRMKIHLKYKTSLFTCICNKHYHA